MAEYFTQTRGTGGNATATTVSTARSIGGASLSVDSLNNWSPTTGNKVHFITYKKKSDGTKDNSTQCDWSAVIPATGTTLTSLTLLNGSDAGNDVGDFVEMAPTASWAEDLYKGLIAQHNTDGTHNAAAAATIAANLPAGSVAGTALADDAVTPAKWTNPYYFQARLAADQTGVADNVLSLVNINSVDFDPNSNFSTSTHKYTAPINGVYFISANVYFSGSSMSDIEIDALINGATDLILYKSYHGGIGVSIPFGGALVALNAGDTVEIRAKANVSSGTVTFVAGHTRFSANLIQAT